MRGNERRASVLPPRYLFGHKEPMSCGIKFRDSCFLCGRPYRLGHDACQGCDKEIDKDWIDKARKALHRERSLESSKKAVFANNPLFDKLKKKGGACME